MTFPETVPRSKPAIALHLFAFLSLTWSFGQLFKPSPIHDFMVAQYGGHWQYLTILSLGISWLVFLFALLKDVFPSINLFARLKTMTSLIATPVEGFVALMYWGLMLIDPSLLMPPDPEFYLPFKLDISIHGLPAVYLWLDFLCFSPPYPKAAKPLTLSASAVLAYVTWMEYAASKNGRFPYPFLDTMPRVQRSLFYLVQVPVVIGLFKLTNGLHHLIRGDPAPREAKHIQAAEAKASRKVNEIKSS
ncbi:uncharacterized protein JCM6883_000936 [Sporobolomyces salmoneus]|uniref:uncharacterized protein n=1 Tax=Sporobolomyces salmoneus TaxID=183962 RepID=UPI00317DF885